MTTKTLQERIDRLEEAVLHLIVLQSRQFVALTGKNAGAAFVKLQAIEKRVKVGTGKSTIELAEELADSVLGEDG